jgi:hypothetical protein
MVMILIAAIGAVATAPMLSLFGIGLTAQTFADNGDQTLRAAGYAFSIWGVIYLGLLLYAVWQALPVARETPALRAVGWPSVIAMAGCGAWLVAASFDIKLATVVIIVTSAAAVITGLLRAAPYRSELGRTARLLIFWPLGLLAGWLTIASAINIITVMTAWGVITPAVAQASAIGGIVCVVIAGGLVLQRLRHLAYGIPLVWGLIGVWVAERGDKPVVAATAVAAAVVIGALAVRSVWFQRRA